MSTGINYQPYIAYTPYQPQNAPIQGANTAYPAQYQMQMQPPIKAPAQNPLQTPVQTSAQAQMPAPSLQTDTVDISAKTPKNTTEEPVEKPLPSLNIGVVDAPNNASKTPITDDLNSRAGEIEKAPIAQMPEQTRNTAPSLVPSSLGKKPLSAGKLSAYLMFGSLGITALMIIPKGISKIVKLIKHK